MRQYEYKEVITLNSGDRDFIHEVIMRSVKDPQMTPDEHKELIQFAKGRGYTWVEKSVL